MPVRPPYTAVLAALDLPQALAAFDARVIGTPPLGLDMPTSDIDLICHARDSEAFSRAVRRMFGREENFTLERLDAPLRPVVVNFRRSGWPIEIYAIDQPASEQPGWLHFDVERRLLRLGDETFTHAVRQLRLEGLKTEPAFAAALRLEGDPFQALTDLSLADDPCLNRLLVAAGYDLAGRNS